MVAIKIHQLIDRAIGYPEAGHVNFSALQCLLICMAEKLGITAETINYDETESENEKTLKTSQLSSDSVGKQSRLIGGFNPEDNNNTETPNAAEVDALIQSTQDDEQMELKPKINQDELKEETSHNDTIAVTKIENNEPEILKELQESPRISKCSEMCLVKSKEDMSKIEMILPPEFLSGISIMKDQLEFVIEQLLLATYITLSKRPDSQQLQKLYSMAQTLNEIKMENIHIKGVKVTPNPFVFPLNWASSNLKLNEDLSENELQDHQTKNSICVSKECITCSQDTLKDHLCYSPSKLLDQLMTLKSEFCLLTNKVNELSAGLLEHESQHLQTQIQEIQIQIRSIKMANVELRDHHSRLELRITNNQNSAENLKRNQEEILQKMVDKTYFELQLANKVDYNQLQTKVSLDQVADLQCRIDKRFNEILKHINDSEKQFTNIIENLKITVGPIAIDEVLAKFKENISQDMQQLNDMLSNYIAGTSDDCAAAGARVKMLQNLSCLSCDRDCVMPVQEKSKSCQTAQCSGFQHFKPFNNL